VYNKGISLLFRKKLQKPGWSGHFFYWPEIGMKSNFENTTPE